MFTKNYHLNIISSACGDISLFLLPAWHRRRRPWRPRRLQWRHGKLIHPLCITLQVWHCQTARWLGVCTTILIF